MWLHLLFNTIIPFTILVAMNMSIYKKLVSVSLEQYYGRSLFIILYLDLQLTFPLDSKWECALETDSHRQLPLIPAADQEQAGE